jgi:hypothetical protein
MLKAVMTGENGREVLVIGLSFGNLDKFREKPMDSHITIDGATMGLPIDVLIFSGETEMEMGRLFAEHISKDTKVHIDPKLAS